MEKQQQLSFTQSTDTETEKTLVTTHTPEAVPAEQGDHGFHAPGETDFPETVQPRYETNKQANSKPWVIGRKQYPDIIFNALVSTHSQP